MWREKDGWKSVVGLQILVVESVCDVWDVRYRLRIVSTSGWIRRRRERYLQFRFRGPENSNSDNVWTQKSQSLKDISEDLEKHGCAACFVIEQRVQKSVVGLKREEDVLSDISRLRISLLGSRGE